MKRALICGLGAAALFTALAAGQEGAPETEFVFVERRSDENYRGLGRLETCRIRAVEAVESKEVAESLVEQRSAAQ
jgi:hypothetical protein